ncbi:MAG: hypothetical protein R2849_04520 [Thermomicrobiales bacterium]
MTDTYDVIVVGLGSGREPDGLPAGTAQTAGAGAGDVRAGPSLGIVPWPAPDDPQIRYPGQRLRPLAERAFELWDELEDETGQQFLTMTGEVRLIAEGRDPRYKANAAEMEQRGAWRSSIVAQGCS